MLIKITKKTVNKDFNKLYKEKEKKFSAVVEQVYNYLMTQTTAKCLQWFL